MTDVELCARLDTLAALYRTAWTMTRDLTKADRELLDLIAEATKRLRTGVAAR